MTLGLEGSFNAAVGASVESVVRDFAKGLVLGRHYEAFPQDRPSRAEVAGALVRGTRVSSPVRSSVPRRARTFAPGRAW